MVRRHVRVVMPPLPLAGTYGDLSTNTADSATSVTLIGESMVDSSFLLNGVSGLNEILCRSLEKRNFFSSQLFSGCHGSVSHSRAK